MKLQNQAQGDESDIHARGVVVCCAAIADVFGALRMESTPTTPNAATSGMESDSYALSVAVRGPSKSVE